MRPTTLDRRDHDAHDQPVVYRATATAADRRLGWAAITSPSDGQAFVNVHVESGALPPRTRELLLDAVMSLVSDLGADQLLMVLPSRDAELLAAVGSRCDVRSTRPIGMTCLVKATVRRTTPVGARPHGTVAGHRAGSRVQVSVRALSGHEEGPDRRSPQISWDLRP